MLPPSQGSVAHLPHLAGMDTAEAKTRGMGTSQERSFRLEGGDREWGLRPGSSQGSHFEDAIHSSGAFSDHTMSEENLMRTWKFP